MAQVIEFVASGNVPNFGELSSINRIYTKGWLNP